MHFGPYVLAPAFDGRGVRRGYWVLPAVRHPLTGEWYSPVVSTAEVYDRAMRYGWRINITTITKTDQE
jgi:hypothetical protein